VVIGNCYEMTPTMRLHSCGKDADAVTSALTEADFEVHTLHDATVMEYKRALEWFMRQPRADVLYFYFSGHGITVEGDSFLLLEQSDGRDLVQAQADCCSNDFELKRFHKLNSIDVGEMVNHLSEYASDDLSAIKMMVVDACRMVQHAPSTKALAVDKAPKLSRINSSTKALNRFLMFSCSDATAAYAGVSAAEMSAFTSKFVPLLKQPGLELSALQKTLTRELADDTARRTKQIVEVTTTMARDFYFLEPVGAG